jgi:hypothetical protein
MRLSSLPLVFPIFLLGLLGDEFVLSQPRTFLLDAAALTKVKRYINESKAPYNSAYGALLKDAKKALAAGPFSVVNKTVMPPSGDKHDFYNYGPYWWPDSTKPDGLPYIRRDGEVNPETQSDKFDDQSMSKMTNAVETLALAFSFRMTRITHDAPSNCCASGFYILTRR